ncbi:MAG TPA: alkaline phosphatase [Bacteroidales bacterium]|nr:alkaline phosphatase [Bacteroidales bacterium]HBZ20979.1 alkaline phosphatase [Bacteroidales bacterium]
MRKILIPVFLLFISLATVYPQYSTLNAHSHNDYENTPPFSLAYENHFGSIEADIWAVNGELFVSHNEKDIIPSRTLDSLYIRPIVRIFRQNGGRAWTDNPGTFQLLIDLKTPVEPTLSLLIQKLIQYPEVFNPQINKNAIRIVITGNRPMPAEFINYPAFVFFDGNVALKYNKKQLKRIALYSENFRNFSSWNGEGEINEKENIRLKSVIDSVHSMKKKIRYWNAPDDNNSWNIFMSMKIDFINTDHIRELADHLKQ